MFNSATNATISCKILVKIGSVISAESRIACVFTSWFGVFRRISPDVLYRISKYFHRMIALYVPMMDLYLTFEFDKVRCHGNQIMLP